VLAITGHHYHDLIDTFAQQDVDLDRVFQDVALYSTRVMGKNHVESVTNLACRTALSYRGVAHINFPVDLPEQEAEKGSKRALAGHSSTAWARRAASPSAEDLARAAAVLSSGSKVDPYEPPMPARTTLEQARKLAEALVRGEPAREKIVRSILKDRVKEMI